jgi:hypothetical protein
MKQLGLLAFPLFKKKKKLFFFCEKALIILTNGSYRTAQSKDKNYN